MLTILICAGIILALLLACSVKEKLAHRLILLVAAVLLACLPATAQQPEVRGKIVNCPTIGEPHKFYVAEYSCDPIVEYALKNRQQEGSFYFFPFPWDHKALGRSRVGLYVNRGDRRTPRPTNKASETQTILGILATAEKVLGLEFPNFQVDRDPDSGDSFYHGAEYIPPVIHGIFARTKREGGK